MNSLSKIYVVTEYITDRHHEYVKELVSFPSWYKASLFVYDAILSLLVRMNENGIKTLNGTPYEFDCKFLGITNDTSIEDMIEILKNTPSGERVALLASKELNSMCFNYDIKEIEFRWDYE